MCAAFGHNARIAQSVEQRIENPRVGGSIPPPGTNHFSVPDWKYESVDFWAQLKTLKDIKPSSLTGLFCVWMKIGVGRIRVIYEYIRVFTLRAAKAV